MNCRTVGFKKWLCFLCFSTMLPCEAGSVRLLSGELHRGKLAITDTGLTLTEGNSTVTFDLANILNANFEESAAAETESHPAGVVLTNGSFVAGITCAFEDLEVKVSDAVQSIKVPRSAIAAILFAPAPHATMDRILNGKTGAVLLNGDFFEGDFSGIKDNSVVINSPLFGPHRFGFQNQASASVGIQNIQTSAVLIQKIQPQAPGYEIRTKNGSRFLPNDIKIDHDRLNMSDPLLGPVKVSEHHLVEIRAGGGRCQLLTDLKPLSAVTSSGADAAASVSIHDEGEGLRALTTGANVAVSFAIPPKLTVFMCRVTMPQESSSRAPLSFTIYCDGRFVFRSSQISLGMNPQNLRVNLGTAQRITLRVEPLLPGSGAAVGKWIEPILLRQ